MWDFSFSSVHTKSSTGDMQGFFSPICVDITDNELAYLECIHLFVEILDHFFSNVCELDLVFNFHKVTAVSHQANLAICNIL